MFRNYLLDIMYDNENKDNFFRRTSCSRTSKEFNSFKNNIVEGVIFPIVFKIKQSEFKDIEVLNSRKDFKLFNIKFIDSDKYGDAYFDIDKKQLLINVNNVNSPKELESIVGHELIHRIQDERSKEKYSKWVNSSNFDTIFNGTATRDKENLFNFNNPFEAMAYAYQFVYQYKKLDIKNKSISDLYKKILLSYPEFKNYNRFKKYVFIYYENMYLED